MRISDGSSAVCSSDRHGFTDAAQLRALSVDELLSLPRSGLRGPFVDGQVVTRSPRAAIAAGGAADIPIIIGSNSDEARPLMRRLGSDPQTVLSIGRACVRDRVCKSV